MSFMRTPSARELAALSLVAEAGGGSDTAQDVEAADECLVWGWLVPQGACGYRLTEEGWAALKAVGGRKGSRRA